MPPLDLDDDTFIREDIFKEISNEMDGKTLLSAFNGLKKEYKEKSLKLISKFESV